MCGEGSGRLGGVLPGGGRGSQRGPGCYASPTQAMLPCVGEMALPYSFLVEDQGLGFRG